VERETEEYATRLKLMDEVEIARTSSKLRSKEVDTNILFIFIFYLKKLSGMI